MPTCIEKFCKHQHQCSRQPKCYCVKSEPVCGTCYVVEDNSGCCNCKCHNPKATCAEVEQIFENACNKCDAKSKPVNVHLKLQLVNDGKGNNAECLCAKYFQLLEASYGGGYPGQGFDYSLKNSMPEAPYPYQTPVPYLLQHENVTCVPKTDNLCNDICKTQLQISPRSQSPARCKEIDTQTCEYEHSHHRNPCEHYVEKMLTCDCKLQNGEDSYDRISHTASLTHIHAALQGITNTLQEIQKMLQNQQNNSCGATRGINETSKEISQSEETPKPQSPPTWTTHAHYDLTNNTTKYISRYNIAYATNVPHKYTHPGFWPILPKSMPPPPPPLPPPIRISQEDDLSWFQSLPKTTINHQKSPFLNSSATFNPLLYSRLQFPGFSPSFTPRTNSVGIGSQPIFVPPGISVARTPLNEPALPTSFKVNQSPCKMRDKTVPDGISKPGWNPDEISSHVSNLIPQGLGENSLNNIFPPSTLLSANSQIAGTLRRSIPQSIDGRTFLTTAEPGLDGGIPPFRAKPHSSTPSCLINSQPEFPKASICSEIPSYTSPFDPHQFSISSHSKTAEVHESTGAIPKCSVSSYPSNIPCSDVPHWVLPIPEESSATLLQGKSACDSLISRPGGIGSLRSSMTNGIRSEEFSQSKGIIFEKSRRNGGLTVQHTSLSGEMSFRHSAFVGEMTSRRPYLISGIESENSSSSNGITSENPCVTHGITSYRPISSYVNAATYQHPSLKNSSLANGTFDNPRVIDGITSPHNPYIASSERPLINEIKSQFTSPSNENPIQTEITSQISSLSKSAENSGKFVLVSDTCRKIPKPPSLPNNYSQSDSSKFVIPDAASIPNPPPVSVSASSKQSDEVNLKTNRNSTFAMSFLDELKQKSRLWALKSSLPPSETKLAISQENIPKNELRQDDQREVKQIGEEKKESQKNCKIKPSRVPVLKTTKKGEINDSLEKKIKDIRKDVEISISDSEGNEKSDSDGNDWENE